MKVLGVGAFCYERDTLILNLAVGSVDDFALWLRSPRLRARSSTRGKQSQNSKKTSKRGNERDGKERVRESEREGGSKRERERERVRRKRG